MRTLEEIWRADIAREQDAVDLMRERAAAFAEAVAAYPLAWNWGDGCGGAVTDLVIRELKARGFERKLPDYPNAKPKRPAMTATRTLAVFKRDRYRCVACGTQEDLTVDHIVPVNDGGDNEYENLQTLCRPCNTSKGVKSMDEWLAGR